MNLLQLRPLHPKGDPRRSIQLAVRNARILGMISIVGAIGAGVIALSLERHPGIYRLGKHLTEMFTALCLAIGLLYIVCAGQIRRQQPWAVAANIYLAAFQTLLILAAIYPIYYTFLGGTGYEIDIYWCISFGLANLVLVIWLAAMVQALFYLFQARRLVAADASTDNAFAPIMVSQKSDSPP